MLGHNSGFDPTVEDIVTLTACRSPEAYLCGVLSVLDIAL